MTKCALYIHVPFCHSKCTYCDFYSITNFNDKIIQQYVNKIILDIEEVFKKKENLLFNTVFFGGGTPLIIGYDNIKKIINCVKTFNKCIIEEITVEINPLKKFDREIDILLKDEEVNRISIGIQSVFSKLNDYLGRKEDGFPFRLIHEAYNNNKTINIDIIIGYKDFDPEKLFDFLNSKNILKYIHSISGYILSISQKMKQKEPESINFSDEIITDQYIRFSDLCEKNGFAQYEISNFCRPEFECLHNIHYWKMDDYIGLGPNASSKIENKIYKNRKFPEFYKDQAVYLSEPSEIDIMDILMMRLRLFEGVDIFFIKKYNLMKILKKVYNKYRDYIVLDKKGFRFNRKGFIISNDILSYMLLMLEDER